MPLAFSPCVLTPCYDRGAMTSGVLDRLRPFNFPCIMVDDGSDETTRDELVRLTVEYSDLTLTRLPINTGKDAAVIRRIQTAVDTGLSHAVQVNVDGQHAIEDVPRLFALAKKHPTALISR